MVRKKNVNLGEVSKRASKIIERQKKEFAADFKAAHGDKRKIKAAAAKYRKAYGATPAQRRKKAMKLAAKHMSGKQKTIKF